jgi:Mg2+-importing ATPase
LDRAIIKFQKVAVKPYRKVDEIPFDFQRRVMSVVVETDGVHRLITKGAPEEIFRRCSRFELDGEVLPIEDVLLADLKEECDNLSAEGFRVLAIGYKDMAAPKAVYSKDDEAELVLKGYLAFLDPPKPSTKKALGVLKRLGIECKVLTGDNQLVTKKICADVGLDIKGMITGDQVEKMPDEELRPLVETTTVFARLSPLQKERVIRLLHDNGHIVGYMGDGINDAPSLKASDVGISVDNAVDIAKESADLILLKKSLAVLEDGVLEGRRTFGNIVKYIKMGASSNFGNMFSMTGASLLLPFLPMLPIQILLNNLLYDTSQVAIPSDEVDKSYLMTPRPWDVGYIKKLMFVFGPLSSLFDFITFGALLLLFPGRQDLFHTGWFLESICTQVLVVHIIRTEKIPFIESRPSRFMVLMSLCILAIGFYLPFSPLAAPFHFARPPLVFFPCLLAILLAYLFAVQTAKNWFVKKYGFQ